MSFYPIIPMAAPRLTQRDRWKQRPVVMKYFTFRDEVRSCGISIPIPSRVIFRMPMPKSWSKRKKSAMEDAPHKVTPDIDNILKGLLDAVYPQGDAMVWSIWPEKRWNAKPGIEVIPMDSTPF